jgi:hypothetical protein
LPTQVSLLTLALTRGPVSLVTMVSEPGAFVGSWVWAGRQQLPFLYWLLTLTHGPVTIIFGMKLASLNY